VVIFLSEKQKKLTVKVYIKYASNDNEYASKYAENWLSHQTEITNSYESSLFWLISIKSDSIYLYILIRFESVFWSGRLVHWDVTAPVASRSEKSFKITVSGEMAVDAIRGNKTASDTCRLPPY